MAARPFQQFSEGDFVVLHSGPQAYRVNEVNGNLVRVGGEGWVHWASCTLVADCDWYLMNEETESMTGPFPTREDAEACIGMQMVKTQKYWSAFSASGQ